jgi:enoyl-CoA hydratase/carnithine racemase
VIQFVQARMGVTPGWGGAVQLADLVGKREALKILASSKKILPTQALDMGLVDEIIPQGTVSCWNCLFT